MKNKIKRQISRGDNTGQTRSNEPKGGGSQASSPPGQGCHHPSFYFVPFQPPISRPTPQVQTLRSPLPPIADVPVPYPSPSVSFWPTHCHFHSLHLSVHFSPPPTRRPHVFTPSYRLGAMTSSYLPVLLVSVTANAATPDDSSVTTLPTGQVDYLSHQWREEDVWSSWKNMTRQKNAIANGTRLENASWRTWWKQRNKLKTISPETLNWFVSPHPIPVVSPTRLLTPCYCTALQAQGLGRYLALWPITPRFRLGTPPQDHRSTAPRSNTDQCERLLYEANSETSEHNRNSLPPPRPAF